MEILNKKKNKNRKKYRSITYRLERSCTSRTRSKGPAAAQWSPVAGPWLKTASSGGGPSSAAEAKTMLSGVRTRVSAGETRLRRRWRCVRNMAVDGNRVRRRHRCRRLPSQADATTAEGWDPAAATAAGSVRCPRGACRPKRTTLADAVDGCRMPCVFTTLHPLSPPATHTQTQALG